MPDRSCDDATAALVRKALIPNEKWRVDRCELVKLHNGFVTREMLEEYVKEINKAPYNSLSDCYAEDHKSRHNLACAASSTSSDHLDVE